MLSQNNKKIKIIGKKHLEENSYKKITVDKNKEYYEVKALKGDKKLEINSTINLEKLTELDKIAKIVEYYLNNNEINSLKTAKNIRCESKEKRVLNINTYMSFFNKEFIRRISSLIFCKYNLDRKNFLENNIFVKNYEIKTKNNFSSYDLDNEAITLILSSKNDILEGYEKDFLYNFLINILSNCSSFHINTYKWTEFKMSIPCFELLIDNLKINFENNNEQIKELVYNVIRNYNENNNEVLRRIKNGKINNG